MSGRDNLMDFFNLKKEFKRVQLQVNCETLSSAYQPPRPPGPAVCRQTPSLCPPRPARTASPP